MVIQWIFMAAAYLVLFIWLPTRLYPRQILDGDSRMALLLATALINIAAVHILVAAGAFHRLSFLSIWAVVIVGCWWATRPPVPVRTWLREELTALYSDLEGGMADRWQMAWMNTKISINPTGAAIYLLAAAVLGAALYLRLTLPLATGEYPHPDLYIHADWLAQLHEQVIYPSGAYPFGMHALLAPLPLFVTISPLEYLYWSGPFHNWLTVLTLYLFIRKVTGQPLAAVVGALLLGSLPEVVGSTMSRQGTALPQELSMALILPAVWLAFRYLSEGNRLCLVGALAASGVAAFTHPITTLFLAAGLGATSLTLWISGTTSPRRALGLTAGAALFMVMGSAPVLSTPTFGVPLYESGVAFLKGSAYRPALTPQFWIGVALGALALPALFWRAVPAPQQMALALIASHICLYLLPHLGVDVSALSHRASDFLAISLSVGGALVWSWLLIGLRRVGVQESVTIALTCTLVASGWWIFPPF
jgi:hypothetical protein